MTQDAERPLHPVDREEKLHLHIHNLSLKEGCSCPHCDVDEVPSIWLILRGPCSAWVGAGYTRASPLDLSSGLPSAHSTSSWASCSRRVLCPAAHSPMSGELAPFGLVFVSLGSEWPPLPKGTRSMLCCFRAAAVMSNISMHNCSPKKTQLQPHAQSLFPELHQLSACSGRP